MTSAASGEDRIGDGKGRDEDRQRLARRNSSRPTGVLSAGSTRVCPPGGLVTVSIRSTAATRAARRGRRLVHPAVSNVLDRHRNGPSSSAHAATDHPCAASWRTASRPLPETPLVTTASFRKRTCDSLGRCGSDRDVADGGVAAGEQGHRDGGTGRARPGRRRCLPAETPWQAKMRMSVVLPAPSRPSSPVIDRPRRRRSRRRGPADRGSGGSSPPNHRLLAGMLPCAGLESRITVQPERAGPAGGNCRLLPDVKPPGSRASRYSHGCLCPPPVLACCRLPDKPTVVAYLS
jgi:hypothetical protein